MEKVVYKKTKILFLTGLFLLMPFFGIQAQSQTYEKVIYITDYASSDYNWGWNNPSNPMDILQSFTPSEVCSPIYENSCIVTRFEITLDITNFNYTSELFFFNLFEYTGNPAAPNGLALANDTISLDYLNGANTEKHNYTLTFDFDTEYLDQDTEYLWYLSHQQYAGGNRISSQLTTGNELIYGTAIKKEYIATFTELPNKDFQDWSFSYFGDTGLFAESYNVYAKPYPDFTSNYNPVCFIGEDCPIWVQFNEKFHGSTIELQDSSGNILDSKVVYNNAEMEIELSLPYATTTYDSFILYSPVCFAYTEAGVDFSGCGIEKSGFNVYWTNAVDYFPDMSFLDDPCYDVATSSGSFSDDFRYGFECGARKTISWFVKPSDQAMQKFDSTIKQSKENFPINIITHINDSFSASTTATTTYNLIPVINQDGEVFNYVIRQDDIMNSDNYGVFLKFRNLMTYILYFIIVLYFIKRIMTLAGRNDEV